MYGAEEMVATERMCCPGQASMQPSTSVHPAARWPLPPRVEHLGEDTVVPGAGAVDAGAWVEV